METRRVIRRGRRTLNGGSGGLKHGKDAHSLCGGVDYLNKGVEGRTARERGGLGSFQAQRARAPYTADAVHRRTKCL